MVALQPQAVREQAVPPDLCHAQTPACSASSLRPLRYEASVPGLDVTEETKLHRFRLKPGTEQRETSSEQSAQSALAETCVWCSAVRERWSLNSRLG